MKKAVSAVLTISKNMLCIGFGIQIIFGIIWMCFNLPYFQAFAGQGSELFRQLTPMLTKCYPLLYLVQIAVAGLAGYYLFRSLFGNADKKNSIFGTLVLLTFPMGMQCHLSVGPFSLVSSLMLLMLGSLIRALAEDGSEVKYFAAACVCWAGMSFFLPTYFLVGLVGVIGYLIIGLFRKKKNRKKGAFVLTAAAFCGLILGVNAITWQEQMLPDAEQRAFSLCSRMSWPTMMPDYETWPVELKEVVEEDIWNISLFADYQESVFRPLVTGAFGKEKAATYYGMIATDSWNRHKNLIIRQIAGDLAAYGMTPVILPVQLAGKAYASYSGRNYEFFLQQVPQVAKLVMTFFVRWFVVMLLVSVLMTVLQLPTFWREHRGRVVPIVLLLGVTAVALCVIYTFRGAGVMDYKCSVFANLLWLVWAVTLVEEGCSREK